MQIPIYWDEVEECLSQKLAYCWKFMKTELPRNERFKGYSQKGPQPSKLRSWSWTWQCLIQAILISETYFRGGLRTRRLQVAELRPELHITILKVAQP